jgi:hypothetical protein
MIHYSYIISAVIFASLQSCEAKPQLLWGETEIQYKLENKILIIRVKKR